MEEEVKKEEVEQSILVGINFENERRVQSRSERLLEKELRDTSQQTIKLVANEEVLDLSLSTLDLGKVLDASKELLQKAKLRSIETKTCEIQSYKIIPSDRSGKRIVQNVTPEEGKHLRNHSRSMNQSMVGSPKKHHVDTDKTLLQLKNPDFTPIQK